MQMGVACVARYNDLIARPGLSGKREEMRRLHQSLILVRPHPAAETEMALSQGDRERGKGGRENKELREALASWQTYFSLMEIPDGRHSGECMGTKWAFTGQSGSLCETWSRTSPVLSPNSWGHLLLSHTRRTQCPLEPLGSCGLGLL